LLDQAASLRWVDPPWRPILVVPVPGPLAERAIADGIEVHVLPMPRLLERLGDASSPRRAGARAALALRMTAAAPATAAYLVRLRLLLRNLRPAVVHTHGLKQHLLAALARPAGVAVVWHLHDHISGRVVAARLLRTAAPRAARLVAVSASVAADARVLGRTPEVVHNAVDLAAFAPEGPALDLAGLASLPPPPGGGCTVGLVATLGLWKGHEVFLRALAALPPEAMIRGYVIGGGIYRTRGSEVDPAALRALAARLGLEGRVGFTGFVDDPGAAIRALDVVVHASTVPEPFGLVVAEGMACGRAVVTTGTGGSGEIVTPGVDAVVVEPGDASGLADALRDLAGDPAERARIGAAGRATAERRFDRARLGPALAGVYLRAIGGTDA
jgi:glycosyltransferase involved in cell wall biosynthesis